MRHSGISEEEKVILRQKLLSHIQEPVLQVATQLAVIISKIARYLLEFTFDVIFFTNLSLLGMIIPENGLNCYLHSYT